MRVIKIYKTFTYAETDTLWGKRYQISIGGRRLTLLNYRSMLKFIEVLIYNGISQSDTAVPLGKLRDWIREIHALMGLNMQQFLETMATSLFWGYPGPSEVTYPDIPGYTASIAELQRESEINQIVEGQRVSDRQMTHAETETRNETGQFKEPSKLSLPLIIGIIAIPIVIIIVIIILKAKK